MTRMDYIVNIVHRMLDEAKKLCKTCVSACTCSHQTTQKEV